MILILSAGVLIFSCSPDKSALSHSNLGSSFIAATGFFKQSQALITVMDSAGQPLQAEVLIGTGLNDPFTNNLIQTDAKGQAVAEKYFWKNSIQAYRWVKRDARQSYSG